MKNIFVCVESYFSVLSKHRVLNWLGVYFIFCLYSIQQWWRPSGFVGISVYAVTLLFFLLQNMSAVFLHRKLFHRRIVLQGAAKVVKNHNFVNVSLKYQSNRTSSIKNFGACIPLLRHLKHWFTILGKTWFLKMNTLNCNILLVWLHFYKGRFSAK